MGAEVGANAGCGEEGGFGTRGRRSQGRDPKIEVTFRDEMSIIDQEGRLSGPEFKGNGDRETEREHNEGSWFPHGQICRETHI